MKKHIGFLFLIGLLQSCVSTSPIDTSTDFSSEMKGPRPAPVKPSCISSRGPVPTSDCEDEVDFPREKQFALVIGINNYEQGRLTNAVGDAQKVAASLRDIGIEVQLETDLKKSDLEDAIANFANKLAGANVGIIYFSGHGSQFRGEDYILPMDNKKIVLDEDLKSRAIKTQNIIDDTLSKASAGILILDACRTNSYLATTTKSPFRGLSQTAKGSNSLIAYATPSGTEIPDNGKYSKHLSAVLKQRKNQPIEQVFKEVSRRVSEEGAERPVYTSGIVTEVCLGGCSRKPPPEPINKQCQELSENWKMGLISDGQYKRERKKHHCR